MVIEFDYDLAKEALELGTGKIVTRYGDEVSIINWESPNCIPFPIMASVKGAIGYWAKSGRWEIVDTSSPRDLMIELL